ncbi:hypothetical protein R1flu_009025 [Riccia fluitans]|uniref:Uncharacterized protein n=1 Tax=Riccia fluitans TaxID=41844 RepID=A0ABD1Z136_9MARC
MCILTVCTGCFYSLVLEQIHPSVETSRRHSCPGCFEDLFDSMKVIAVMPCGHTIHLECSKEIQKHSQYSCPMCLKSVSDTSKMWERLGQEVAATPMPEAYPNNMVKYGCDGESSLYGLEQLFSAELQSDNELYRQEILDSLGRDLETTIRPDSPNAATCSTSMNEIELTSTVFNHPLFRHIITASVALYKTGIDEEEGKRLDELAELYFPNWKSDAPDTTVEDSFSSQGRDLRLDLCLEKYLHLLQEFMLDVGELTASAATVCNQIKNKVIIKSEDLGDSLGRRHSESDSASGINHKEEEETTHREHADQANNSAVRPRKTLTQSFSDEEWKGAILASYDPKVLKRLKEKHLKEGRKNAKLPDPARVLLMEWWTKHTGNPYPTEEEKILLAKQGSLEIDQINNWFINQRKRHCCTIFSENRKSHSPSCYKMVAPRR